MVCKLRFCSHCGKQIADEAAICLNCGCTTQAGSHVGIPQQSQQVIIQDDEPQLATWAKICGIVSFFTGFAVGIVAIVLACMSKDETNGTMCSSAKVGYVCGIISTVLSALLIAVLVMFIFLMV